MNAPATLVLAAAFACLMSMVGYILIGPVPAVIFAVFLFGGLVLWRFTTYGRPADPERIVVPYLLTVMLFIVHVLEEYLAGFPAAMTDLTGYNVSERNFLMVAAFIGPLLWLAGLVLFYLRTELGNYLTAAFFVAMTISELAHFAFPVARDGSLAYFPGLYTAALPLIPAWVALHRFVREGLGQTPRLPRRPP